MKLFLSSYRFGGDGDRLRDMLGDDAEIGVITNAKDYKSIEERLQSVQDLFASFAEWGMKPHEIDLRLFATESELLEAELQKYACVWLAGGNTFVLRKALKSSGADEVITKLTKRGEIVYGGESAGAIVAGPSLQGAEFEDDPDVVPDGYDDEDIWDGLGLVSYVVVPHYESGLEGVERMVDLLEESDTPYKTIGDTQVLIIQGDETELVG